MSRKAEDFIRNDVMSSAREAGLTAPLWAGASCGGKPDKDFALDKSVDDLAREARQQAESRGSATASKSDAHNLEADVSVHVPDGEPPKPEAIESQLGGWLGGTGLTNAIEPLTDEYFLDH